MSDKNDYCKIEDSVWLILWLIHVEYICSSSNDMEAMEHR